MKRKTADKIRMVLIGASLVIAAIIIKRRKDKNNE